MSVQCSSRGMYKNRVENDRNFFEVPTFFSCEWGNSAENWVGKFKIYDKRVVITKKFCHSLPYFYTYPVFIQFHSGLKCETILFVVSKTKTSIFWAKNSNRAALKGLAKWRKNFKKRWFWSLRYIYCAIFLFIAHRQNPCRLFLDKIWVENSEVKKTFQKALILVFGAIFLFIAHRGISYIAAESV